MILKRDASAIDSLDMDARKLPVLGKSLIIGLLVGVVVALYRLLLDFLEKSAFSIYGFVRENPLWIPPMFIILILVGLLVGRIMKAEPTTCGSGTAEVKKLIAGRTHCSWWRVLIAKVFASGVGTLGGLALGREGPCVQLGACVAQGIGDKFSRVPLEKKVLLAGGAGAGMGAALNAPLAGVIFAIEEIFKYFSPLVLLSTLTAGLSAQFVCRSVFGIAPLLEFPVEAALPLGDFWVLIILGIIIGVSGSLYKYILLWTRTAYNKVKFITITRRPVIPYLCAGILALIMPEVLCAGHAVFAIIAEQQNLGYLFLLLLVKFAFVMICLGSNTPGGDLFPILAVGALLGSVWGTIAINFLGFAPEYYYVFIILSMAGFFTSIVGAPITAVVLLLEMTGSFPLILSLAVVCLISYVITDLIGRTAVYQKAQLAFASGEAPAKNAAPVKAEKTTFELMVEFDSPADGKTVKDLDLPPQCLLVAIKREDESIVPHCDTKLAAGDCLLVLAENNDFALQEQLLALTTAH